VRLSGQTSVGEWALCETSEKHLKSILRLKHIWSWTQEEMHNATKQNHVMFNVKYHVLFSKSAHILLRVLNGKDVSYPISNS